jgi:hypothetical protein
MTRDEIIFLILSFFSAFILRELIVVRLFPDSINYLTFARNILSGIHHAGDLSFLVSFRRPPLYPHLIAFLAWGNQAPVLFAEVGRQISIVSGSLLIFPLYFLTRKMVNKEAAFFSVVLMVLLPEFVYYSGAVLTESLCTFIVLWIFLFLWAFESFRNRIVTAFVIGIVSGLAFLCRHLSIGYLGIAIPWVFFIILHKSPGISLRKKTKKALGLNIVLVAGFMIGVLPQSLYLHSETGKWALAVDPFSLSYQNILEAGGETRHTREYEARASLTEDKEHYVWEKSDQTSFQKIVFSHPIKYLKAYLSTISGGYLPDTYPMPYPLLLIILVAFGIIRLMVLKEWKVLLFLFWGAAGYYLFLALFLNLRDRYMFTAYPLFLIAAGSGGSWILLLIRQLIKYTTKIVISTRLPAILISLGITAFLLPETLSFIKNQNSLSNTRYFTHVGEDLSKRIDKGSFLIDRTPHLAYFAGGVKATPPFSNIEDVLYFARKRGIKYWIISSSYVPRLRPQYKELLRPELIHDGLRLVAVYRGQNRDITIVYSIISEGTKEG